MTCQQAGLLPEVTAAETDPADTAEGFGDGALDGLTQAALDVCRRVAALAADDDGIAHGSTLASDAREALNLAWHVAHPKPANPGDPF